MKKNWILLTFTLIGLAAVNTCYSAAGRVSTAARNVPFGSWLSRQGWRSARRRPSHVPTYGTGGRFAPTRVTTPTITPTPQPVLPVVQPTPGVNPWAVAGLFGTLGTVSGAALWDQYKRAPLKARYRTDPEFYGEDWVDRVMQHRYKKRLSRLSDQASALRQRASSAWQSLPTRQEFAQRIRGYIPTIPTHQQIEERVQPYIPWFLKNK